MEDILDDDDVWMLFLKEGLVRSVGWVLVERMVVVAVLMEVEEEKNLGVDVLLMRLAKLVAPSLLVGARTCRIKTIAIGMSPLRSQGGYFLPLLVAGGGSVGSLDVDGNGGKRRGWTWQNFFAGPVLGGVSGMEYGALAL